MISSCIFELFCIRSRFKDHQVNITDFFSDFTDGLDDHRAITDIGNKSAVHYVKMKPVSLTFIQHFTFFFEFQEICGQQRRGDNSHSMVLMDKLSVINIRQRKKSKVKSNK